jgi:hypothetical protein
VVQRLNHNQMLAYVRNVLEPSQDSAEEWVTEQFNVVCMNCPDPVAAADVLIETPPPTTADELLEKMLAYPERHPSTYSEEELSKSHPFRWMQVDD